MSLALGIGLGLTFGGSASWFAPLVAQLGGQPDYVVDGTAGDDGNAGTLAAPWATITQLRTTLAALGTGQTRRAIIRAGTYTNQHLEFTVPDSSTFLIACEEGVTMDGAGSTTGAINVSTAGSITSTMTIYGNGLIIGGWTTASANSLGTTKVNAVFNDIVVTDAEDGITCHGAETVVANRCNISGCNRAAYNISGSGLNFTGNDCTFTGKSGASAGVMSNQAASSSQTFNRCIVIPATADQAIDVIGGTWNDCQIGSLTVRAKWVQSISGSTFNDCFLNYNGDLRYGVTFTRCYGLATFRVRAAADAVALVFDNCVFVGPATGLTGLFYGSNLGAKAMTFTDNIVTGYASGTAIGQSFGATDIATWNSNVTTSNNCLFGNNLNYHASLTTATDDQTTDPLIGDADTVTQSDYQWVDGTGSPCEGNGTSSSNIGFSDLDLAA